MVPHLAGLVMICAAAALLWSALRRRRLALAARAEGEVPPKLHPSLVLMGEIGPPVIRFGLLVAGGQVVLAYFATGGGNGAFSLLDLGGFLALLLAYDTWLRIRTRYRRPSSHSVR